MGLDQYIYREKKDSYIKRKELENVIQRFEDDFDNNNKEEIDNALRAIQDLKNKNDENTDDEIDKIRTSFVEKHKDYYDNLKKLKDNLDKNSGNREELAYWRKFWTLHSYIEKLLGSTAENCEDTVISKNNFTKMLKDVTNAIKKKDLAIFGEISEYDLGSAWDILVYTRDAIKSILDSYDDDYVYYYHPWW